MLCLVLVRGGSSLPVTAMQRHLSDRHEIAAEAAWASRQRGEEASWISLFLLFYKAGHVRLQVCGIYEPRFFMIRFGECKYVFLGEWIN